MEVKMSKINDLISPKVDVVFRGETFTLESGFTLEETPAINMAFGSKDDETKAIGMKQLVKFIMKRLYPTATDAEISRVDASYMSDILEVFGQLNKEEEDEEDEKAKELLSKLGKKE